MMYSEKFLSKHATCLTAHASQTFGALAEEENNAVGPRDQRQGLSEAEDRASVAHLGEDAQEAAGKALLSMGGDKRNGVLGTGAPLTSNHVQCLGSMQQFIDEVTTVSKTCIYTVVFTRRPSKARYEQGATMYVEAVT